MAQEGLAVVAAEEEKAMWLLRFALLIIFGAALGGLSEDRQKVFWERGGRRAKKSACQATFLLTDRE